MSVPERIPFVALLLAAGSSARFGREVPKQYLAVRGRTLLEWSAARLARLPGHVATVVAVDPVSLATRVQALRGALERSSVVDIVEGGELRQDSCRLAFAAAVARGIEGDVVVVHDCARPFFSLADAERAIGIAYEHGGAILGHRARDTLKRVDEHGRVEATIERDTVFQAATPQVFRRDCFERMLAFAAENRIVGTDEAGLAEACGIDVRAVESTATNVKITVSEDLEFVRGLEAGLERT